MAIIIYVEKFASYTTMHGFPRIVASKATPKRLAWIIVFTTAWLFFTIHTSLVLSRYFEYPINTKTEIVSGGVPFPDITLCNLGSFDFYTVYRLSKGLEKILFGKGNSKKTYNSAEEAKDKTVRESQSFHNNEDYNETEITAESYLNDTFIRAMYKYYEIFRTEIKNASYRKTLYDKLFSRTNLAATMPAQMLSANGVREKEFIVKCTFGNEPCTFKKIFDPYFFNCFTFMPPKVALTSSGEYPPLLEGIDNGFSAILLAGTRMLKEVDTMEFLRLPGVYASDSPFSGAGGIRVVIHPPGSKPFPMTEGYDVPPERMASLGINLERHKRLGQPYGHCRRIYPFLRKQKDQLLTGPYRRTTCVKACIQHLGIRRECKCLENTLPTAWEMSNDDLNVLSVNETMSKRPWTFRGTYDDCLLGKHSEETNGSVKSICEKFEKCSGTDEFRKCFNFNSDKPPKCDDEVLTNLVDRIACAEKVKRLLMTNATFLSNCGCHPACDNILYDVSYSLSQWPSDGIDGQAVASEIMHELQFTKRFTPEEKRKFYDNYRKSDSKKAMKDFSKINVYVSDADVFLTTEEPAMTVTDLISDIGGQLGVWIGVSVLTLAEVLEILIAMVIDCCRKRYAKHNKAEAELKEVTIGDCVTSEIANS